MVKGQQIHLHFRSAKIGQNKSGEGGKEKKGYEEPIGTKADPRGNKFLVWTTRIEILQSTPTKVLFILLRNQSTLSPDEDQQYSGGNVAIHI